VEISSILQKANDTYQVRWVETTYSNGMRRSREEYTGLFQVKLMPPRDERIRSRIRSASTSPTSPGAGSFRERCMRDDSLRPALHRIRSPNPEQSDKEECHELSKALLLLCA
jgi:hypothetical protein